MGFVVVTPSMAAPLDGEKRSAYLARQKIIRIASVNADGSIYLSSSWYVTRGHKIYIPIDGANPDGVTFEGRRPIAGLVDSGDEYTTFAGVRIQGTSAPVDDPVLFEALEDLVFEKYFYFGHPYADPYFRFGQVHGRKYYELVPDKVIGWDNRETASPPAFETHRLPKSATDRRL